MGKQTLAPALRRKCPRTMVLFTLLELLEGLLMDSTLLLLLMAGGTYYLVTHPKLNAALFEYLNPFVMLDGTKVKVVPGASFPFGHAATLQRDPAAVR